MSESKVCPSIVWDFKAPLILFNLWLIFATVLPSDHFLVDLKKYMNMNYAIKIYIVMEINKCNDFYSKNYWVSIISNRIFFESY